MTQQSARKSEPRSVTFVVRVTCRDRDALLRWAQRIYSSTGEVSLTDACELLSATLMAPESLVGDDLSMVDARLVAVRVK